MKKQILTLLICLIAVIASAQQDTTVQVTMTLNQFKAVFQVIDTNIDSKKISRELLEFLQKSAKVIQPADKPKPNEPKTKKP